MCDYIDIIVYFWFLNKNNFCDIIDKNSGAVYKKNRSFGLSLRMPILIYIIYE